MPARNIGGLGRTKPIPVHHFIPPTKRNTQCKVEINGVDVTGRTVESQWVRPNRAIGTARIILSNSRGQFSGDYNVGDTVLFYADNSDATTLQFYGRIDYVKENISDSGQFLEIDCRHRSFLTTEYLVCYSADDQETSEIIKAIIDAMPESYGITYTNIQASTKNMSVDWQYKPFWECINELCNKASFDCYIDDDLDMHYFPENSVDNPDDVIVEGANMVSVKNLGDNNYYEKTRAICVGKDRSGLPIVYTAISDDEGDDIREVLVNDSSANKYEKVRDIAIAKLEEITNRNTQANALSFGLTTINPGERIWISVPRQKINDYYKITKITHKFGMKVGGWRTEIQTEDDEGVVGTIQNINKKAQMANNPKVGNFIDSENIARKYNYSYNFDFEEDTGVHSETEIDTDKQVLKLITGQSSGYWISPTRTLSSNMTGGELKLNGEQLTGITVSISLNGGTTWKTITTGAIAIPSGKDLKLKVSFNSTSSQLKGLAFLYS